ncbi:MAG: hypothetical protein ACLSG9_00815 [Eubacterium sp.]
MKKAVIGASVKTIGAKAFYQAKKLKSLVVKSKKTYQSGQKCAERHSEESGDQSAFFQTEKV